MAERARPHFALARAGFAAAVLLGLALRLGSGLTRDLWEDEVIAATEAAAPWWQVPLQVLRFDVHPPLYFLQLHVWSLLGHSDLWLKLNSLLWNAVACAGLYLAGRRLYGRFTGLAASALFLVFPPAVWMALEVRPYSWLYALIIASFTCLELACRQEFRSPLLLPLTALCLALVYSHALGFLIVFLLGVYGFAALRGAADRVRAYRNWALVFGVAALGALPPLASDLLRDANLGGSSSAWDMLGWVARIVLPLGTDRAALVLAGALAAAVIAGGLWARSTRRMAATFLVLPLLLCAAAQALGHTIYKPNIFSTIAAPFFLLVSARLAMTLTPPTRTPALALGGLMLAAGSAVSLVQRTPTTGFLAASRLIAAQERPGDVVYVPQASMFWGIARYLAGPAWGSPLAIAAPPAGPWRAVYDRLGPGLVQTLGLAPASQQLPVAGGPTLLTGNDSLPVAARAPRVWLVTYPRADLPPGFPPAAIGPLRPGPTIPVQFLRVTLYE